MIPVASPEIRTEDVEAVARAVASGWVSVNSPDVLKFEKKFCEVVMKSGGKSLAVNSGTSALHLALVGLGVGKGDEVLIPDLSMIAVANAVTYVGATPVLVDCASDSWNMDLQLLERAITRRTKAIVVVHTYGAPNDMEKYTKLCRKHDLLLVEDVAEAMGSMYKGKQLGNFGDVAAFSLYANKNITTGEGGVVFTKKLRLYREMRKYRHHYFGEKQHFRHDKIGYSYGMTGMQAALGISQLKTYGQKIEKKKWVASEYEKIFRKHDVVVGSVLSMPGYLPWMNAVVLKSVGERKMLEDGMERNMVETRRFFLPIHMQKPYRESRYVSGRRSQSRRMYQRGLLLPSGPAITKREMEKVGRVIGELVGSW